MNSSLFLNTEVSVERDFLKDIKGFPKSILDHRFELCSACYHAYCDIQCKKCKNYFHKKCMNVKDVDETNWMCSKCEENHDLCQICQEQAKGGYLTCKECHYIYHKKCMDDYSYYDYNNRESDEDFICPEHYCFICEKHDKSSLLLSCVYCKRSYHKTCIPDYSIILSPQYIICSLHPAFVLDWKHQDFADQISKAKRKNKKGKLNSKVPDVTNHEEPYESSPTQSMSLSTAPPAYVYCERCKQWRQFPPGFSSTVVLSSKWFCEYNTWSDKFCNCIMSNSDIKTKHQAVKDVLVWLLDKEKTNPKTLPFKMNIKQLIYVLYYGKNIDEGLVKINYGNTYSISSLYTTQQKSIKRLDDFSEDEEFPLFKSLYELLKTEFATKSTFTINDMLNNLHIVNQLNSTISLKAQLFLFVLDRMNRQLLAIQDEKCTLLSEETVLIFIYSPLDDAIPFKFKKIWRKHE